MIKSRFGISGVKPGGNILQQNMPKKGTTENEKALAVEMCKFYPTFGLFDIIALA